MGNHPAVGGEFRGWSPPLWSAGPLFMGGTAYGRPPPGGWSTMSSFPSFHGVVPMGGPGAVPRGKHWGWCDATLSLNRRRNQNGRRDQGSREDLTRPVHKARRIFYIDIKDQRIQLGGRISR